MLPRKCPQAYHMVWVGDENIVNDLNWREGSLQEDSHQAYAKPASDPSSHIHQHDIHQLSRPHAPWHPSKTNPPLPRPRWNKAGNVNPPDAGHSQLPPQVLMDNEVDESIERRPLATWEREQQQHIPLSGGGGAGPSTAHHQGHQGHQAGFANRIGQPHHALYGQIWPLKMGKSQEQGTFAPQGYHTKSDDVEGLC